MGFEIRDAVYGDIVLLEDEARLLDTYEMQRLRHVRQLGNVSLVYPSANHTRFEHSLGVRWMTQKIDRISDLPISRSDRRILYKCALLHDIAEPAFAHATERLATHGFVTHEQIIEFVLSGTYKEKVLEKKDVHTKFICDVITAEEEREEIRTILAKEPRKTDKAFMRDIVRGYIDADNLDYLRRDSFFLGLPYGNYDDRIFASFRIVNFEGEDRIAFRDSKDTLNAIVSILDSRYTLRRAAYLHHGVIIADDMLLEALKLALSEEVIDLFDVFICGDYELLAKMKQSPGASPLVDSLLSRSLFKRIYVLDHHTPYEIKNRVTNLENNISEGANFKLEISEKTGTNSDKIILHYSPPSGWKDFDRILLVSDDGEIVSLGNKLPGNLSLLKEKYDSLWQFMVSANVTSKDMRDSLFNACVQFFNYRSGFTPKKTFDEIREIEEELSPLIKELRVEEPSSIPVLRILLDHGKPLSRDEIAKELNIKPATVSHYLTLINKKLSSESERILYSRRVGRVKLWTVDRRLREVLGDV